MNIKKLIPTSLKNFYHHYQASSAVKRYGFPSRRLKVIGITGTDGKTTTTTFLTSVLRVAGFETGMISTIRAEIGGRELDTGLHVTTPDAADVQRYLSMMVEEKMEYAVLEVTSHGLRQGRVFGVDFDVAVVTNITPEHLDQHGTFEQYREDKGKLFSVLASSFRKPGVPKVAVVNRDDIGSFEYLSKFFSDRQIVYGCVDEAEVWASDIVDSQRGVGFVLHSGKDEVAVYLKIPGHYNVSNALAVASVALSQGIDLPTIKVGLEAVEQVSGRMEYVTKVGDPFTVIVDFAHTPNSLEQALKSLRSKLETENKVNGKQGKLLVLFGCAGERDPYKRGTMGEIAGRLADVVIVTSEDPRDEDPQGIIDEVVVGLEKVGRVKDKDFWGIVDRKEAVFFAVGIAEEGDIVDLTGKGHEQSQCVKGVEYPWDERDVAREAIKVKKFG